MTQLEQDVGALASLFANVPWGDESKRRRCQEIANRYGHEIISMKMLEAGSEKYFNAVGPTGEYKSGKEIASEIYRAMRAAR